MWALLPLKDFVQAKQRLSGTLTAAERRSLFHAMVEDVLNTVCRHGHFQRVVLVSDDPAASLLAEHFGAYCWPESEFGTRGLNAVITASVRRAVAQGAESVAIIHGDLPLISDVELRELLRCHRDEQKHDKVTLATDRHGQGSNILLCTPPGVIPFGYGPGSHDFHAQQACERGAAFQSLLLPGLSRDIDNHEDLLDLLCGRWTHGAENTLRYLRDSGIATRLAALSAGGANSDSLLKENDRHASK